MELSDQALPKDSGSQQATNPGQSGSESKAFEQAISIPSISLPTGGGAIQGIGEKFQVNPATGTGSLSIPIAMSPGRNGFTPALGLSYDSGGGNGPFGLGWSVGVPSISRKTQKGLPKYQDEVESDVFILSGAEDLVPILENGSRYVRTEGAFTVCRYRPRIEGLFARIERWYDRENQLSHWRTISKDNITTCYGETEGARLSDPEDDQKVFSWYIERSYDDKGNLIVYEYRKEDGEGIPAAIYEQNRHTSQCYLKRVRYGNRHPYLIHVPDFVESEWQLENSWLFELIFDYGEHTDGTEEAIPGYEAAHLWAVRQDPFSSFRSGFDMRSYRLCQRVLMFHHFDELAVPNYLVRSTEFEYQENPVLTRLLSVTHRSFEIRNGEIEQASFPPVSFRYSEAEIDDTVRTLEKEAYENLPQGIDNQQYQWIDLEGEGISGILSRYPDAWYYKRNLGGGNFGPKEQVAQLPSIDPSPTVSVQLQDLNGDGFQNVVVHSPTINGFFELTEENEWNSFRTFADNPNLNWNDPDLRLLDLTGDGFADLLITQQDVILWYPSKSKEGYEVAQAVHKHLDETHGPTMVFSDAEQAIYLTDMTGDGLTDILRIRNGEVCYWANKGYGEFSHKITLANSPQFDFPDRFDQKQIRLADIDGSGTTDLFYLEHDRIRFWLNQAGNSLSEAQEITHFPYTHNLASISVIDLLGRGTACLVWSSPLPGDEYAPLRYIDLMHAGKPHLMLETNNNMGAITRMQYASSTQFYLEDRLNGRPWITKLPFPVHVLERVETYDAVDHNHFVSRYAYHHGYFDGIEREFRGFGMVEQWDTEDFATVQQNTLFETPGRNWSEETDIPPVYTKSWFHTGFCRRGERISRQYEAEYFSGDEQAWLLPDTQLPTDIATDEIFEAARALKGSLLRQEVYAADGSEQAEVPYSVTESCYSIQRLQAKGTNRHAVFLAYPQENISYHYERNPADPRITHTVNLAIDEFGNVTHSASIAYPRRAIHSLSEEQNRLYIVSTEHRFVHFLEENDQYRHSLPLESLSFEVNGLNLTPTQAFEAEQLREAILDEETPVLPHEQREGEGLHKRSLSHTRICYYDNSLSQGIDFGTIESLAVPYETYTLAYTEGILADESLGGRITPPFLEEAGYRSGADLFDESPTDWWIPSGRQLYHVANQVDLEALQDRFYMPLGAKTALGVEGASNPSAQETYLTYDDHHLLPITVTDPLGNQVEVQDIDYRLLQPASMLDPNGTTTRAAFDLHGMVIATAIIGSNGEGDSLANISRAIASADGGHLQMILDDPATFLGQATSWFYYDLFAWMRNEQAAQPQENAPNYVIGLSREIHVSELAPGGLSPIQIALTYSDGFGRELLAKVQAEPGEAPLYLNGELQLDNQGEVILQPTNTRWVGNGRTVFNNKGKSVHQYEPFFDSNPDFTDNAALVEIGVTPTLHYDPLGRNIRTDLPDGTLSRVEFTPWEIRSFDPNDTVSESQWHAERINLDPGDPRHIAALQTEVHADTPSIQHLDSLGRPFVSIAHNRFDYQNDTTGEYFLPNHSFLDIEGNPLEIWDGRNSESLTEELDAIAYNQRDQANLATNGNLVVSYFYAMNGIQLFQDSMDAGRRWALVNVLGNPVRLWDAKGNVHESHYDALQRPTHLWVENGPNRQLVERLYYGEELPDAADQNLIGQLFLHVDGAGAVINQEFDFKGNLIRGERQLAAIAYGDFLDANPTAREIVPDWSVLENVEASSALDTAADLLESEIFSVQSSYDALNLPIRSTSPDGSVTRYHYNEANFLDRVETQLQGQSSFDLIVSNIDYNARGQRMHIHYANGSTSRYDYDPVTFRLTRLLTTRNTSTDTLQDIHYTYDPVGNITHILDHAQAVIFHDNALIEPRHDYVYDSLYQLIRATGRESRRINGQPAQSETISQPHPLPENPTELRTYTELYFYDPAGNIQRMRHIANGGSWTRAYQYAESSNRLLRTSSPGEDLNDPGSWTNQYPVDPHGSMNSMPHLATLSWDHKDQLVHVDRNGDGEFFYTYDSSRQRVRKVVFEGSLRTERIYLGSYEVFRQYAINGSTLQQELQTLHIMDDQQRVCMVETPTIENGNQLSVLNPRFRYQLGNHLGSVALETDESAQVITYEEYHPYGTTAYRTRSSQTEVSEKRYLYTGMERDEETGLSYHTARYYVSWLGRWGSADPAGIKSGPNLYLYTNDNPINLIDLNGKTPTSPGTFQKDFRKGMAALILRSDNQDLINELLESDGSGGYKLSKKYDSGHTTSGDRISASQELSIEDRRPNRGDGGKGGIDREYPGQTSKAAVEVDIGKGVKIPIEREAARKLEDKKFLPAGTSSDLPNTTGWTRGELGGQLDAANSDRPAPKTGAESRWNRNVRSSLKSAIVNATKKNSYNIRAKGKISTIASLAVTAIKIGGTVQLVSAKGVQEAAVDVALDLAVETAITLTAARVFGRSAGLKAVPLLELFFMTGKNPGQEEAERRFRMVEDFIFLNSVGVLEKTDKGGYKILDRDRYDSMSQELWSLINAPNVLEEQEVKNMQKTNLGEIVASKFNK